MERETIKTIWYEFEAAAGSFDLLDSNADVVVTLSSGRRWAASFFTYQNIKTLRKMNTLSGECLCGTYFCADSMILVSELSKEVIQAVLQDIIQNGALARFCTRLETEEDQETMGSRELMDRIAGISGKEGFLAFLEELRRDFLSHPRAWANTAIDGYLEAMAQWVEDVFCLWMERYQLGQGGLQDHGKDLIYGQDLCVKGLPRRLGWDCELRPFVLPGSATTTERCLPRRGQRPIPPWSPGPVKKSPKHRAASPAFE